jgi:hypothetical protein
MNRIFIAALFTATTLLSFAVSAQNVAPTIPPVETWEEMPVPYPDTPEVQAKFLTKWHKDPRGDKYEGATGYFVDSKGEPILILKDWEFWDDSSDGSYRNWSKIRVAMLMEDGKWIIGEPGEMLDMDWTEDGSSLTLAFDGAHSAHSRTLTWK